MTGARLDCARQSQQQQQEQQPALAPQQRQQAKLQPVEPPDKQKEKLQKLCKKRRHSFESIMSLFDSEFDEFDTAAVRVKPESLDKLVKLTKFNRRELKWMYRGFKQSCPSGVVKEDKFQLIYAQFFPRGAETSVYAKFLFQSLDKCGKSEVSFTDFVFGLSKLMNGSVEEKLRWVFQLYDLNGDGVITRDELQRVVCAVHDLVGKFALSTVPNPSSTAEAASQTASNNQANIMSGQLQQLQPPCQVQQQQLTLAQAPNAEQIDELFRKFDLNDDGLVTIDEFLAACKRDPAIVESMSVFKTIF